VDDLGHFTGSIEEVDLVQGESDDLDNSLLQSQITGPEARRLVLPEHGMG
jgi:hypothetical protein